MDVQNGTNHIVPVVEKDVVNLLSDVDKFIPSLLSTNHHQELSLEISNSIVKNNELPPKQDVNINKLDGASSVPPWAKRGNKKSLIVSEDGDILITTHGNAVQSPGNTKNHLESPKGESPYLRTNSSGSRRKHASKMSLTLDEDNIDDESDFLIARLEAQKKNEESVTAASIYQTIADQILGSFQSVRETLVGIDDSENKEDLDWDFWGLLLQNYDEVARKDPRRLTKKLHLGIPHAIRGMVWQLMCKGKDPAIELTYNNLLTRTSAHEKLIQRDLARTFPKHEYFQEVNGSGQESLFNVVKAYSLFDPEVGYCQGISFIVGPLLLNMPEEEAFCCCVRLMKDYNFRELFTPKMTGLQTWLFQFDKVLEEQMPAVSKHLELQGILSTMYASQWFMTCFAYRFPLDIVFRIYDIVFAEGIEVMFRFGLALIKRNQDTLLTMEFEQLLNFLKIGLFDPYLSNVTQLIHDASAIRLPKNRLDKLASEYKEKLEKSGPEHLEKEQLRTENRRMHEQLRRMEEAYEQLNREHISLANDFITAKMSRERADERIEELEEQINQLKGVVKTERVNVEQELHNQMEILAVKNLDLSARNAELIESHDLMKEMLSDSKLSHAECENERQELKKMVDILKRSSLTNSRSMGPWSSAPSTIFENGRGLPRSTSPDSDPSSHGDVHHNRDRSTSSVWSGSFFGQMFKP
ncbi:GTPase-activating protein [Nowakowskiella sp. JEL0078]|nr:GTPase-activating protein [Nowakowskiella sp. JEL0078]